jgi:hypothetical protein
MTMGRATSWLVVATATVSGVAVAMAGTLPARLIHHPHANSHVSVAADATTVQYDGVNVTLAPPPAGATPAVSPAAALGVYQASGVFPSAASQSPQPVDVQLYDFSDNTQGEIQADNSVKLTYQHVLAWAVIFHAVPYQGVGGVGQAGTSTPVPEDIVTIVDANTGKMLEAFAA